MNHSIWIAIFGIVQGNFGNALNLKHRLHSNKIILIKLKRKIYTSLTIPNCI